MRTQLLKASQTAAVLALLALTTCSEPPPATPGAVGSRAPAYSAATLEGDSLALDDLHGQPALVNVWATWCAPCRKEMPDLQTLHERYGPSGLRVIGVSVDAPKMEDRIREFLDELGITFQILYDPEDRITSTFDIRGVPVTLLLDPDGTIIWRHLGPVTADDPDLLAAIERFTSP